MNKQRRVVLFLALTFLSACRSSSPQHRYPFAGEIIGIDRSTHELIVHHEDIPNYMKGMTMPFAVKDTAALDHIQIGQRIKATLVVTATESWLEDIQVTRQAPPDAAQPHSQFQIPVEGAPVPDFALTNQDGQRVHLAQYKGKVLLLTFIYTRCPLPDFCPRMTHNFLDLEESLRLDSAAYDRTHLLTITFDPKFDTPAVLRQHALAVTSIPAAQLFPHWEFLAPRPQDLDTMAHFFGLSKWEKDGEITHSLSTVIIDREGKLYRWYHGNGWTTEELLHETRSAAGVS